MCHFLAPAGQPGMMHENFMHWHLCMFAVRCSCMQFFRKNIPRSSAFSEERGVLLNQACGQSALEFMTSLADLTVRRRKIVLRVKDMTSAMGKDHHTNSSRPVRDSSHATGSNTTI